MRSPMRPLPLLLLLLAAPLPAAAQTVLHLSETAHVGVYPDELAAGLKVSASSANAAGVQTQVNTLMASALEQVRAAKGVVFSTGSYQVWHNTQPDSWNGEQSIELHATNGEALLKLLGALQTQGVAMTHLGWRVAPETAQRARDQATKMALGNLRGRADAAAAILGLRFASFREVRLQGPAPFQPVAPRMMAMAKASGAEVAPSAETEQTQIEASVEADVLLSNPDAPVPPAPQKPKSGG